MSREFSRRELLAGVAGAFVLVNTPDVAAVANTQTDVFTQLPLTRFVIGEHNSGLPNLIPSEVQPIDQEREISVAENQLTILTNRQRYERSPNEDPLPLRHVGKGITELRYTPDPKSPTESITVFLPRDARSVGIATSGDSGTASNMVSAIPGPGEGNRYLIFSPSGNKQGPGKIFLRVH